MRTRLFPLKQEVWEKLIPPTINGQFNALYGWDTMPGVYGKVLIELKDIKTKVHIKSYTGYEQTDGDQSCV